VGGWLHSVGLSRSTRREFQKTFVAETLPAAVTWWPHVGGCRRVFLTFDRITSRDFFREPLVRPIPRPIRLRVSSYEFAKNPSCVWNTARNSGPGNVHTFIPRLKPRDERARVFLYAVRFRHRRSWRDSKIERGRTTVVLFVHARPAACYGDRP